MRIHAVLVLLLALGGGPTLLPASAVDSGGLGRRAKRAALHRLAGRSAPVGPGWNRPRLQVASDPSPASRVKPTKSMDGRFFGEYGGPVRSLVEKGAAPVFAWRGTVENYAVLAVSADGVNLLTCGVPGTVETENRWAGGKVDLTANYVVLTTSRGGGRTRVIQRMNVAGENRAFVELDDRFAPGASRYEIVAHAVPRKLVDELYDKAETDAETARLWKLEKTLMTRTYPGLRPSLVEAMTLVGYDKAEKVTVLAGHRAILAWPVPYVAETPTAWRFLAEIDAAMDWLTDWTDRDQVKSRGKRLISRFRTDQGGTALFVSFRLHIPRKEMTRPPDHGPYSHEVSHGYIGFPAVCPTGRYNEGLTEVSRVSYWHHLGLPEWRSFRERCVESLAKHHAAGGRLDTVPGYGGAAAVYFELLARCAPDRGGSPDWPALTALFRKARATPVAKGLSVTERYELFASVCEAVWGKPGRSVLEELGMPE